MMYDVAANSPQQQLGNTTISPQFRYLFVLHSHTDSSSHTSASFCSSSVSVTASVSAACALLRSASVNVIGCRGKNPESPSERERQKRTFVSFKIRPSNKPWKKTDVYFFWDKCFEMHHLVFKRCLNPNIHKTSKTT